MGAAILCQHVSTVAQNMFLLRVWWFYPHITARIRHI